MKRIVNFFIFVDRTFARLVNAMLIVTLFSMVVLTIAQVVLRNFFNSGIAWGDIVARHMVLWVAFLGAMLATRIRQHLTIDAVSRLIPRRPRNVLRVFLDALACVVSLFLAMAALEFALDERVMGAELFIGIPVWIAEAIIPFGFFVISIEYAIGIALDFWRLVTNEPGHVAGRGRQ